MEQMNPTGIQDNSRREFLEYMQMADDFMKIELLRPARKWYNKALEFDLEPDHVREQIAECERKLAFENKVVYILSAIGMFLLMIWWIAGR